MRNMPADTVDHGVRAAAKSGKAKRLLRGILDDKLRNRQRSDLPKERACR
jgi:hypothetical protein